MKRRDDKGRKAREVDLHLKKGYNSKDAIDRQLAMFRGELDNAMRTGVKEIIFIHGIGSSILKEELRRIISEDYPFCSYQDAPFSKFGFGGATLVTINR